MRSAISTSREGVGKAHPKVFENKENQQSSDNAKAQSA